MLLPTSYRQLVSNEGLGRHTVE